jgi:hypothetical protein
MASLSEHRGRRFWFPQRSSRSMHPGKPAVIRNTLASKPVNSCGKSAKRCMADMYTVVVVILAVASLVGAWGLLMEAVRESH